MSQNILSQLRRQYNYVKKGLIWGKNNLIKVTNKKCNGHFFKPVTFSFDIYRGTMVQNSIQHSCGYNLIMEYLTPITIRFIRCKNNRSLLISFRHKLEETMSTFAIKRQISHLIDYQQFVLCQSLEFIFK